MNIQAHAECALLQNLVRTEARRLAGLDHLHVGPSTFGPSTSSDLRSHTACNVAKDWSVMARILLIPLGRVSFNAIRCVEPCMPIKHACTKCKWATTCEFANQNVVKIIIQWLTSFENDLIHPRIAQL